MCMCERERERGGSNRKRDRWLDEVREKIYEAISHSATPAQVKIGWKSFDEEKQELIQQLEKVKMRQIIRIQDEMRKVEQRKDAYLDKTDKQVELIQAEIDNLNNSIDNSQVKLKVQA